MVNVKFDIVARKGSIPPVAAPIEAGIIASGNNTWPPASSYEIIGAPGHLGATETFSHLTYLWRAFYQFDTRQVSEIPTTAAIRIHIGGSGVLDSGTLKAFAAQWTDPITAAQWDIGTLAGTSATGPFTNESIDIPLDVSSIILGNWSQFMVRVDPENRPNPWYYAQYSCEINGSPELILT